MRAFPACLAFLTAYGTAQAADLTIAVHDVAAKQGDVRVALYVRPETFRKEAQAFRVQKQTASAGEMRFVFTGLPEGRYAAVVYHDENRNGKMDLLLGMFPDEGWGLSNNPDVIGPPPFDDSAFAIADAAPTRIDVNLSY